MPKTILKFESEDKIPAELKAFKTADNTVEIWYGGDETVGKETNSALATKNAEILNEKKVLQDKYDILTKTSGSTDVQVADLQAKLNAAQQNSLSAEDKQILETVKQIMPNIPATEVKDKLSNISTIEAENLKFKTEKQNQEFFALSGFKNETVFNTVLNNKDFNPNLVKTFAQDVDENGTVRRLYAEIKQADGTTKNVTFADYVKSNKSWTPFLPSLTAGGDDSNNGRTWIGQNPNQTPLPDDGKPKIDISKVIEKQNAAAEAKTNPLFAPPAKIPENVPQN